MLLYIMNIIYKIHHICNIDRILSDEAANLLVVRSIASISKNRLCQYAIAQRASWLFYRLTRVKRDSKIRDSKIRASQAVDNRTTWGSRKEDSTSVLFYCTKVAEILCSRVRGSPFVCVFSIICCSMLCGSNLASLRHVIPITWYENARSE